MLINELIGYRANPIYQKAKATFVPSDDQSYRRSKSSERSDKMEQFTSELVKYGFRRIGFGTFGTVYEKSGYPWIFKIFNTDPAYLTYLKWAIMHQSNPHAPKIKGKILKINDNTFAVRMERLTDFNFKNDAILSRLQRMLDMYTGSHQTLYGNDRIWVQEHFPKLVELMDEMSERGFPFDIHKNNIMMRGNTPVIIDPVYDPENME